MIKLTLILFFFLALMIDSWPLLVKNPEIYPQTPVEGKYVLKIKGPSHKKIIFCQNGQTTGYQCQGGEGIHLKPGQEEVLDFSQESLTFGDVNADNKVNVNDWSAILSCRNANAKSGEALFDTGSCRYSDGNFDGEVNNFDLDLLYRTLSSEGS